MLCHGLYITVMLLAQTNCSFVCLLFHICPLNLSSHHISPIRGSDISMIIIHYDKTFMMAKPTKMEINGVSRLLVLLCIRVSDEQWNRRTKERPLLFKPVAQQHFETTTLSVVGWEPRLSAGGGRNSRDCLLAAMTMMVQRSHNFSREPSSYIWNIITLADKISFKMIWYLRNDFCLSTSRPKQRCTHFCCKFHHGAIERCTSTWSNYLDR